MIIRILMSLIFYGFFSSIFGQIDLKDQREWPAMVGFGYGYASLGNDITGSIYSLEGRIFPKNNKRLSVTSRLSATVIENRADYGNGFTSHEKSNGLNIDSEISIHLAFWRFTLYPSLGPSIRIVDEKVLTMESFAFNVSNQVIDYDNRYSMYTGIKGGFTTGITLDFSLSQYLKLGVKLAGYAYHDGSSLRTLSIYFRKRHLLFR